MLNNVILVGRLVAEPEVKILDSGLSVAKVTLAVNRSFRTSEGDTETDFISCSLWEGVATAASTYCKKGSIIAVKGRLAEKVTPIILENGEKVNFHSVEVIGERVSFIKT
jgi:single-strand DNA-binding protein